MQIEKRETISRLNIAKCLSAFELPQICKDHFDGESGSAGSAGSVDGAHFQDFGRKSDYFLSELIDLHGIVV